MSSPLRILSLALALAALSAAPAAAAPTLPFGQTGRWITDADGRVVMLHGLNMISKLPPYDATAIGFGADDARFLAEHGFNTLRIGFIYKGLEPQPGAYDDAYLERIAALEQLLGEHGVYPLVDFHQDMYNERYEGEGFPDWAAIDDGLPPEPRQGFPANYLIQPALWRAYDHFFANDAGPDGRRLQDAFAAAWRRVAQRLRRSRALVGYDVFNEPFPGSQYPSCANPQGCPVADAALAEFHRRVFAAIRQVDSEHTLFYEPYLTFNNGARTNLGDLGDPRSAMSFHVYCLGATPGFPAVPGSEDGCEPLEDRVFTIAEDQVRGPGDALLVTEFGATDDLALIERIAELAERHMVGWQYWSYWNVDPCCPRPDEGLLHDIAKPPAGDNVKQHKLAVLERAYPQVVAGTPLAYDFDRRARRFEMEYSTTLPSGARAAAGAETEIYVPRLHFPGGYHVEAGGARVVSPPDAALLRVVAAGGAQRPGVRVTPRTSREQPAVSCLDRARPSVIVLRRALTRRRIRLSGRARDRGCRGTAGAASVGGRIGRVEVSIGRRVRRGRCRFLAPTGRRTLARPCARRAWARARGTTSWSFDRRLRLRPGRYTIGARAIDARGNVSRPIVRRLRVR